MGLPFRKAERKARGSADQKIRAEDQQGEASETGEDFQGITLRFSGIDLWHPGQETGLRPAGLPDNRKKPGERP